MMCGATSSSTVRLPGGSFAPRRAVAVPGCGEVAVTAVASGCSIVTLDWSRIFGKLPFAIPFCSATLYEDGTVYVSGNDCARRRRGERARDVEGGPKAEACARWS